MDRHMQVLAEELSEQLARALGPDLFEITHAEYYGTPSEGSLAMDRQIPGLAIDIKPVHLAGFSRMSS